ncbi:MAG: uracil-DNA glycosylase [Bacteriovoracaceae bacterium]
MLNTKLEKGWSKYLKQEFDSPYMVELMKYLQQQQQLGKTIYPETNDIFNALSYTPFDQVKVVIIGQDPYHGPGQAHGLSFSVRPGIKTPPSLVNIYKEINREFKTPIAQTGCLIPWAKQGVLLLNTVLTVEANKAASHQKKGWELFTDKIVNVLNNNRKDLVFVLWGAFAQKKGANIDSSKHLILKSTHPSPLSAHRGFLGCGHFGKINKFLLKTGQKTINWQL